MTFAPFVMQRCAPLIGSLPPPLPLHRALQPLALATFMWHDTYVSSYVVMGVSAVLEFGRWYWFRNLGFAWLSRVSGVIGDYVCIVGWKFVSPSTPGRIVVFFPIRLCVSITSISLLGCWRLFFSLSRPIRQFLLATAMRAWVGGMEGAGVGAGDTGFELDSLSGV
ncbi:hypothetical protein JAAARDRAFT_189574 [Jaapia argillacea MUCL 33604]|uniref:Uncharacterized protein n=1 Tax=Jaapia argillacea MUCL 33604 TaxID=933084 RepID=A0A067QFD9_9AGAM|nr:hypothetical protein JAAARDRAFT_189574 [Jaapia argillacea MUCL 33604]